MLFQSHKLWTNWSILKNSCEYIYCIMFFKSSDLSWKMAVNDPYLCKSFLDLHNQFWDRTFLQSCKIFSYILINLSSQLLNQMLFPTRKWGKAWRWFTVFSRVSACGFLDDKSIWLLQCSGDWSSPNTVSWIQSAFFFLMLFFLWILEDICT